MRFWLVEAEDEIGALVSHLADGRDVARLLVGDLRLPDCALEAVEGAVGLLHKRGEGVATSLWAEERGSARQKRGGGSGFTVCGGAGPH